MFINYIRTALRSIRKNKIFSIINITGLSVGLTCFMLISAYIYNELTYDRYAAEADNIYRVNLSVTGNGNVVVYPDVDIAVGKGMMESFPEVKSFARVFRQSAFVNFNDKQFKEKNLAFADSNFLQMFSIPLIEGDITEALTAPNSIVISREFKKKYFGNIDPLGKTLTVGTGKTAYKVTGVFSAIPEKSHFHFDAFLSFSTIGNRRYTWSNIGYYTYLLLNKNVDPEKLEEKFPQLVSKFVVPEVQHDMGVSLSEAKKTIGTFVFSLQPLTDIHLYSHTEYELEPDGDIKYVYIFSALAIFILLLACVNFTNLSTAIAAKRAKEVGVRKVLGSGKKQLIFQFLSESVIITLLASLFALVIIDLFFPFINKLFNGGISPHFFSDYKVLFAMFLISLFVGVLAGLYPALFLSGFNIVSIMKSSAVSGNSQKKSLRSGLIIFQFFVSTTLIIGTIIVYQQLHYMQNRKLGYNKEQILFISDANLLGNNQDAFKQAVIQDNRVVSASISWTVPSGNLMEGTEIYPKDRITNKSTIHANIYRVDYDYLNTLGIKIIYGRNFSKDYSTDESGVIINEAAVRKLGWDLPNAVGKYIVRSGQIQYKIIGVVKDFNYVSVKQKIAPLMILLGRNYGGLIVKFKTSDISGLLGEMKNKWNEFNPAGPFSYSFLVDKFAAMFASEKRTLQIFSVFTFIALIIAGLGLFGLSSFIIEQRRKEIGIRKVLGAKSTEIIGLLMKEFLVLVLLANVITWPVSYLMMNNWLKDFAFRIDFPFWVLGISGLITIIVSILTVAFQAYKAAMLNPVKSLRYE
jgi:putative ABC transport system permease protein